MAFPSSVLSIALHIHIMPYPIPIHMAYPYPYLTLPTAQMLIAFDILALLTDA